MNFTRLNSVSATLMIRLYKIFERPNMDYTYTALNLFNKLDVIQNRCPRYSRRKLTLSILLIRNFGLAVIF